MSSPFAKASGDKPRFPAWGGRIWVQGWVVTGAGGT